MKSKLKNWAAAYIWYILAFLIPVTVAAVAFIGQGVWPFGERGISIIDSYHQYVPFFSELQNKWRHFDSLFYSWNGGLGMNFWAVIAYYLASPLNLLLLVFPKSMVMECFTLIYLIKVGLAGLSFSLFLRKRFDHYGPAVTVFGCCYGLSSFVIGYGWNIMWLDCIVLLPIVLLGVYRLAHQGRGWLYSMALALCIFTNYYIAIMICIFVCFYFLLELACSRETGPRSAVRRIFGFAGCSLTAGAFGGVMLLPTVHALMASQSAKSSFPTSLKFYHDGFELLCQHFAAIEPTSLDGNFNLYCGVAMLLFLPMYLLNSKIRWGEKAGRLLLTAFLLVSLNTNYLTYIWHGFHFPNGLPGRYSFIYIFMILYMGYEGYRNRKYCPKWAAALSALGWLAFLGFCWWGEKSELETYTWAITAGLLGVYGFLTILLTGTENRHRRLEAALLILMTVETCAYGAFGLCMNGTVNRADYYSDQKAVQTLKKEVEAREGDQFYRVELEERRGRNDVTWQNLPGMSLFSSTANAGVDNLVRRLGFYAVTNKYSYQGATPETDAFLNIDYLISNKKQDRIRTFDWMDESEGENLYINHCSLGLGFMVSDQIRDWAYEKTNPFEVINQMTLSATGQDLKPYTCFGLPDPTAEGCELTEDSWADWSYTGDTGKVTYTYISEEDQDVYIYFKATRCEKVEIITEKSKKSYSDEDGHILSAGSLTAGEEVKLIFHLDDAYEKGSIKLIGAKHDMDVFFQVYDQLKKSPWKLDKVTSTGLKGKVRAEEAGILFTSIPYEKGWSIRVDGVKAEPEKIGGAFIGISLDRGEHLIEMDYRAQGFWPGLALTVFGGMVLVWMYRREGKDKPIVPQEADFLEGMI